MIGKILKLFRRNLDRFIPLVAAKTMKQKFIRREIKTNPMAIHSMRSCATTPKGYFDSKKFTPQSPPHIPKRNLYQDSSIDEYYTMFKKNDEKSKVLKYKLFNGNLKTYREHELKYEDCVVNRPRHERDERVNYLSENINSNIRSWLQMHRNDADKGIYDDF
jgi:hypothetical protein